MEVSIQLDEDFKEQLTHKLVLEVRNLAEPKVPYTPIIKGIKNLQAYLDGLSHLKAKRLMALGLPYDHIDGIYYFDKAKVREFLSTHSN